jgi:hypothetical protein
LAMSPIASLRQLAHIGSILVIACPLKPHPYPVAIAREGSVVS